LNLGSGDRRRFFGKQTEKSLPLKRKRGENPRIAKAEVY
jgi:hypothetical protein